MWARDRYYSYYFTSLSCVSCTWTGLCASISAGWRALRWQHISKSYPVIFKVAREAAGESLRRTPADQNGDRLDTFIWTAALRIVFTCSNRAVVQYRSQLFSLCTLSINTSEVLIQYSPVCWSISKAESHLQTLYRILSGTIMFWRGLLSPRRNTSSVQSCRPSPICIKRVMHFWMIWMVGKLLWV